jgi:hypothetical protein
MSAVRARVQRITVLTALVAAGLLAPAGSASAASAAVPPPEGGAITSITANGTGCKLGENVTSSWTDASGFKVSYQEITARAGAGAAPSEGRKHCLLLVALTIPEGYAVGLTDYSIEGYAALANGASATVKTSNYWGGMPETHAWPATAIKGPYEDNWTSASETALPLRSSCGHSRPLAITTELRVTRGTANPAVENVLGTSSDAATPNASYGLTWYKCGS